MMIKQFDKQNLQNLRMDFDAAVKQLAQKYGIRIALGSIRFDSTHASSKVEFLLTGNAGNAPTEDARIVKARIQFPKIASLFGLKPEHYGATITSGRVSYKLVGLKTKAPKMPVLAQSLADGTLYKLPESTIAPLQSAEYKKRHGAFFGDAPGTSLGTCSNDNAFDAEWKPIGKCSRPATTTRKGFDRNSRPLPYCEQCAQLIDESRAEMRAEGRAS